MASTEGIKVPFFKKGKSRPTTARKRSPPPPDRPVPGHAASLSNAAPTKSEVVLPSRKAAINLLSAGTKRTTSQRDDYDEADGSSGPTNRDGPDVRWTASEGSHVTAALDILAGDEAEELLAKRRKKEQEDAGVPEDTSLDGQYRGQKAYQQHLKKSTEVPKSMRIGPQRSTNTIRTVTITDYQPDVCKDYKETGYCGFGDTCKFLHDRGTYLAGWQLDKLYEQNANKPTTEGDVSDTDSDDEDIPFACLICRKHYTDPVVTRCGHYFCSACAIKRFAKTPKCAACGAPTGGIFNRADKVLEKINKQKKKAEGDDSDGEDAAVEIEGLDELQQESNSDSEGIGQ